MHGKQKLTSYNSQKVMYVYLIAHKTILFIEQGLFTKSKNLCYGLKCTICVQLEKYLQDV